MQQGLCNNNCLYCSHYYNTARKTPGSRTVLPCSSDMQKPFLLQLPRFRNHILRTNARMFSYLQFASKVAEHINDFIVVIPSSDPVTYLKTTKTDGLRQALLGIKNLKKLRRNVSIHIPVLHSNMRTLKATLEYFQKFPLVVRVCNPHPYIYAQLQGVNAEIIDIPFEVKVEVTLKCNKSCDFCYNKNSAVNIPDMPLTTAKKIIDEATSLGVKRLRISGGEPTLHNRLYEILDYAKNKGFYVLLNTNGLADIRKIEAFVDMFVISYNEPHKFRRIDATNQVCTVMTRQNIARLKEFADRVRDKKWFLLRQVPTSETPGPDREDIRSLMQTLIELEENGQRVHIENVPFCAYEPEIVKRFSRGATSCGIFNKLVVGPDGLVHPCYSIREGRKSIREAWKSGLSRRFRMLELMPEVCKKCEYLFDCLGGCRWAAKMATGRLDGMDPMAQQKTSRRATLSQAPFISVIVPTYNRAKLLRLTLNALKNQDYPDFEVIVVDDGSTDNTKELVASFPGFSYIFQERKGFRVAAARNLGAKKAKGEILVFLNDDVVAFPNLLARFANSLQHNDLVLGYTAAYGSKEQYSLTAVRKALGSGKLENLPIIPEFRHSLFHGNLPEQPWGYLVATCFAVRRELFTKEMFDESFTGWGVEDEELGYRLHKRGCSFAFEKTCIGLHMPHPNENLTGIYTREKMDSMLQNFKIFLSKHPDEEVYKYICSRIDRLPDSLLGREQKETAKSLLGK